MVSLRNLKRILPFAIIGSILLIIFSLLLISATIESLIAVIIALGVTSPLVAKWILIGILLAILIVLFGFSFLTLFNKKKS